MQQLIFDWLLRKGIIRFSFSIWQWIDSQDFNLIKVWHKLHYVMLLSHYMLEINCKPINFITLLYLGLNLYDVVHSLNMSLQRNKIAHTANTNKEHSFLEYVELIPFNNYKLQNPSYNIYNYNLQYIESSVEKIM